MIVLVPVNMGIKNLDNFLYRLRYSFQVILFDIASAAWKLNEFKQVRPAFQLG
jgi:hypothetical protein